MSLLHQMKMTDNTIIEQSCAKRIKNFIYNLKDEIGKGFSSIVYRGINEINKEEIAIKVIELGKIKNEVEKYLLNNEMRALRKLSHPNILRCLDILMTKNNVYIVTEYCKKGDLLSVVKKNGRISEFQALKWIKDIAEGYLCMEQNKILHRDMKTANIFVSNDDVLKIADFGFSEFVGEAKPSIAYNVGSPAYMSPQSYQESYYSPQSDVWSIGIIFFEMLVGEVPFKKHEYGELVRNLTAGNLGIHNGLQLREGVKRIMVGCFKEKLNERLTTRKLLELIVHELASITKSGVPMKIQGEVNASFRRSIVANNRRSIVNEVIQTSPIVEKPNSKSIALQGLSAYLNQIFRFGRLLNQNKNPLTKSLIHNIFYILNRHRMDLIIEGDAVNPLDINAKKDYDLIKIRSLEVPQFNQKTEPIDPNLRLFINTPFRSEGNLTSSLNYLKFCIKEFDKLIDSQPKHLQNLGCVMDYLVQYFELLQVQATSSLGQIVDMKELYLNMKDRPVAFTDTHLKLLRYKKMILGL